MSTPDNLTLCKQIISGYDDKEVIDTHAGLLSLLKDESSPSEATEILLQLLENELVKRKLPHA